MLQILGIGQKILCLMRYWNHMLKHRQIDELLISSNLDLQSYFEEVVGLENPFYYD